MGTKFDLMSSGSVGAFFPRGRECCIQARILANPLVNSIINKPSQAHLQMDPVSDHLSALPITMTEDNLDESVPAAESKSSETLCAEQIQQASTQITPRQQAISHLARFDEPELLGGLSIGVLITLAQGSIFADVWRESRIERRWAKIGEKAEWTPETITEYFLPFSRASRIRAILRATRKQERCLGL